MREQFSNPGQVNTRSFEGSAIMNGIILMKIHRSGSSNVMALCDKVLLGRTLKSSDLSIKVSKDFYGGDEVDLLTIERNILVVDSINAIGKDSVELLIESGMADIESVIEIEGIPHVQVYKII
jgi:hypothetical protein